MIWYEWMMDEWMNNDMNDQWIWINEWMINEWMNDDEWYEWMMMMMNK